MPDRVDVSVVLPCLDEAGSVGLCVAEALRAMRDHGFRGEIVVVDNGSRDSSAAVAEAAGARVVVEPRRGYGAALQAGIAAARGDVVVVMADADHSYDLSKLPALVAPIAEGRADLVLGGRLNEATRRTMPMLHRYLGTPVLTFLVARACGGRVVSDSQSGYRAFRREAVLALGLHSLGMEFASEMLIRAAGAGLRILEVPCGYRPRRGSSKLSTFGDGWRHVQLIVLLAPHLVLAWPGLALLAAGLALSIAGLLSPQGIAIGSVHWQPVFFSSIALVLGSQALLAGIVLANRSAVVARGARRHFAFAGEASFPRRCALLGLGVALAGLGIDVFLFAGWVSDKTSAANALTLAGLAQSLIIVGGSLVTFGLIGGLLRANAVVDLRRRSDAGRVIVLPEARSDAVVAPANQDGDVALIRD